jgi:hypothetical protein
VCCRREAVDPVSLVLDALASGAAGSVADSTDDSVATAYRGFKRLIADRFAGNKSGEIALSEHPADPDTWQAPLAKALAVTGVSADEPVLAAARELMELVDAAGVRAGKYDVDLHGGQGAPGAEPLNSAYAGRRRTRVSVNNRGAPRFTPRSQARNGHAVRRVIADHFCVRGAPV